MIYIRIFHFILGYCRACPNYVNNLAQGSSISDPRAKSGPRRPNKGPAENRQNSEEIDYIFFKIHFSVLTIYIFNINEILILLKFSSVMQDSVIAIIIMFVPLVKTHPT